MRYFEGSMFWFFNSTKLSIRRLLLLACLATTCSLAYGDLERVYYTGIKATRGNFSVSPDGERILFTTNSILDGLMLLDLKTGKRKTIYSGTDRTLESTSWSPDGRYVVAISALVNNGYYSVDDMRIILLDTDKWKIREVLTGEGVLSYPFFSVDGNSVYFFQGKKRDGGRTLASQYDINAIDLKNGKNNTLTNEAFYQAGNGFDEQELVVFGATGGHRFGALPDQFGKQARGKIVIYDKRSGALSLLRVEQRNGVFDFHQPRRDVAGNIYFIGAKLNPSGGNYHWFLLRTPSEGGLPTILSKMRPNFGFDIARSTGEIFVMDQQGGELVFRKISASN